MTATLSPAEQVEVTRFGIHDDEVFAEIVEHADDVVSCVHCETPAVVRMLMRCCGDAVTMCGGHADELRAWFERRASSVGVLFVTCAQCRHLFISPVWDEVVREVPL